MQRRTISKISLSGLKPRNPAPAIGAGFSPACTDSARAGTCVELHFVTAAEAQPGRGLASNETARFHHPYRRCVGGISDRIVRATNAPDRMARVW